MSTAPGGIIGEVGPSPAEIKVGCFEDVHHQFRLRADEVQFSRLTIDRLANLASGHSATVLGPQPDKIMKVETMISIAAALGYDVLLRENPGSLARIKSRVEQRKFVVTMHTAAVHVSMSKRFLRKIGALGGVSSRKFVGKRRRRQLARKAALARWAKRDGKQAIIVRG